MVVKKKFDPEKIKKSIKKESREYVKEIERSFGRGLYGPMITDISFWNYKNVSNGAKLEFNFPVSLIIGPNGTNKTSILRALESCPEGKSLSDYWFDTKLDPISMSESKKPEYFYSYSVPRNENDVTPQVRYRRALKRGREDQDYFETDRPSAKLGMKKVDFSAIPANLAAYHTASRWKPIDKEVTYIDMRQRVSAYDINKSFGIEEHLFRGNKNGKRVSATQKMKNRIRRTSKRMFEIFKLVDLGVPDDQMVGYLDIFAVYHGASRVENIPISLSEEEVKWVSYILGRKYKKITVLYHSFFGLPGSTVKVEVENGDNVVNSTKYSEAYAGSGEYAVIMMVHHIYVAKEKSLILMDEPENSLHPESQRRLMKYILHTALNKKIQFIISSHSQYMSEGMPDESRVMLYLDKNGSVEIESKVGHSEAFMGIGGISEEVFGRINIQTEDELAGLIVKEAIYKLAGRKVENYIFNTFGSCNYAYKQHLPTYIKDFREDVLVILDGDQNYCENTEILKSLESKYPDHKSDEYILCRVALYTGEGGHLAVNQAIETGDFKKVDEFVDELILPYSNIPDDIRMKKVRRAHEWLKAHVFYLPGDGNPEAWLLNILKPENNKVFKNSDAKEFFRNSPEVKEYARVFSDMAVSPQDSFKFQEEKIRSLEPAHLEDIYNIVLNFKQLSYLDN